MEEYIDRKKTQAYLYNNMMWYDEDGYIADDSEKDKALWSLVNGVPTADVIERSEYEKVLEENKQLKRIISDKVDEDLRCAFEVKELRSKINKAIEKIKQDMIAHSGTGEEVIQAYCDGLKKALEYLENIGE